MGFSIVNCPFGGSPIYGKLHIMYHIIYVIDVIYIIGQKHKFKIVKIWTDTDLRVWCCTLSWCQKGSSRTCCGSHMGIMYLGGQVVKYCYRRRHLDSQDAAISWQIVSYDGHDGWESSPLGLKSRLGTPLSICTDPWMLQCWSPR